MVIFGSTDPEHYFTDIKLYYSGVTKAIFYYDGANNVLKYL